MIIENRQICIIYEFICIEHRNNLCIEANNLRLFREPNSIFANISLPDVKMRFKFM